MKLEVEGRAPIASPSLFDIERSISSLRSYGKHSFAVLLKDDRNYVQVAGGGQTCMVELRKSVGDIFSHLRAFNTDHSSPFEDGTFLSFGGGNVPLKRDEWITRNQAIEIFSSFLFGKEFPDNIGWRSIDWVFK